MDQEKLKTVSIVSAVVLVVVLLMGISWLLGRESVRGGSMAEPICPGPRCTTLLPSPPDGYACTMDAKVCSDGSSVGRTGPNCEFSPCPGEPGSQVPVPGPSPDPYQGSGSTGVTTPGAGGQPGGVVCTQEMKQCPNGGGVSRTGPNCEFAPCPTTPVQKSPIQ